MKLSLVIAYTYSPDEHRLEGVDALMKSIESQKHRDFETILVEDVQGSISKFPFINKVDKVIAITDPQKRKFNKAWVMNVGAKAASTDNLLFIDAEVSFGADFLECVSKFAEQHKFFNGWSKYVCMAGRDNPHERHHFFPKTITAMMGVFFSERNFFFNTIGGYNENFFGYGGEDTELYLRVDHVFNRRIPIMPYTIFHHYHHWHPKDSHDPLNPDRDNIVHASSNNFPATITKLSKAVLGNRLCPTLI